MRVRKNRLKVKRLFILGAGTSFSASRVKSPDANNVSPLDKDFCKRISKLKDRKRPLWLSKAVREIINHWKDHREFDEFGLESAIIRQLSHMEFIKAIQPRRNFNYTEREFLNQIGHLITFILKQARESELEPYKKLAKKYFRTSNFNNIHNRIITFNYDDLLDQHLINRFEVEQLYSDRIKQSRDQPEQRCRITCDHPLMIKLHGSINWRCSTDEFFKIIDGTAYGEDLVSIDSVWHSGERVPTPTDNDSPCIIPPMPEKPITRIALFKDLWTKAAEYLSMAEEIIICGYSLPDTDQLAFSLFSNFENKQRLKKVVVVDPEPQILKKWRTLLNRTNVTKKVQWTYHSDFVEYVDSL